MLLSQVYHNATNAFEQDPQLRELLMSTFNKSEEPFSVENLAQQPILPNSQPSYMGNQENVNNANPWQTSVEQNNAPMPMAGRSLTMDAQQPNRAAKTGQELTALSAPVTPEYLARIDSLSRGERPGGVPGAPMSPPQAGQPGMPQPSQQPADIPQLPQQSQLAAFLSGLGSSNAILPAIGGGMQAVQDLKSQQTARNHTLRALINRGLDPDTAIAAVSNPEILKQILPRLFGGQFGGKAKLGTILDEEGREQTVFYDEYGNTQPIGGVKPSSYEEGLQKQGLDVIKDYREAASEAETTIGQLSQLKRARETTTYEGMPFADVWARVMGLYGEGGGEDIRSTAANLQLQFTKQTKGAISDREMELFALSTPGLSMSDPGAERVITAMEAAANRTIERNKFFQQWSKLNRGDITGADASWNNYVNDNQIISQDAQGNLSVDKGKISNWAGYLPGGARNTQDNRGRGTQEGGQYMPASYNGMQQQQGGQQPGVGGPTPHDFGEAVPGMYQDEMGRWVMQDPNTGQLQIWEPPQ
jgi:hypothetical protein